MMDKNFRKNIMTERVNEILAEKEEYNIILKRIRDKLKEILNNKIAFECFEDYLKRSRGLLNYEQKVMGYIDKCDSGISEIEGLIDYDRVNDGRNVYYHLVRYRNKEYGIVVSYGDNMRKEGKILRMCNLYVSLSMSKKAFVNKIRKGKIAFYKSRDMLPNEAWEVMDKVNINNVIDKR